MARLPNSKIIQKNLKIRIMELFKSKDILLNASESNPKSSLQTPKPPMQTPSYLSNLSSPPPSPALATPD